MSLLSVRLATVALLALSSATAAYSQSAYGVDSGGNLFRFNLSSPLATTTVGNLGFTPEAIDFRTGTGALYAIDVGSTTTQLYMVNTGTGLATPIGSGFASAGAFNGTNYSLSGSTSFAFDFNPTTLQADSSIRIRLIGSDGTNLRLNSSTGGIAAVDGSIAGTIGAAGYINNAVATMGGPTGLYDIDYASDTLMFQNPPNMGSLTAVGALGVDVGADIGFDILTGLTNPSAGILGDFGFLVDTIAVGSANLYSVDLGTGAATSLGRLDRDFTGGFAIASPVPEPSTYGAIAVLGLLALVAYRKRSTRA